MGAGDRVSLSEKQVVNKCQVPIATNDSSLAATVIATEPPIDPTRERERRKKINIISQFVAPRL